MPAEARILDRSRSFRDAVDFVSEQPAPIVHELAEHTNLRIPLSFQQKGMPTSDANVFVMSIYCAREAVVMSAEEATQSMAYASVPAVHLKVRTAALARRLMHLSQLAVIDCVTEQKT